jgi:hypothetical protein
MSPNLSGASGFQSAWLIKKKIIYVWLQFNILLLQCRAKIEETRKHNNMVMLRYLIQLFKHLLKLQRSIVVKYFYPAAGLSFSKGVKLFPLNDRDVVNVPIVYLEPWSCSSSHKVTTIRGPFTCDRTFCLCFRHQFLFWIIPERLCRE